MIFELVRPKSLTDPAYAEFEYLLRWIGRDGSDYIYMFYDAEIFNSVKNEVVNAESLTRIEALISEETRSIILKADDLSLNDLKVIGEMFANKFVTRLKLDGTIERYAPDSNSFNYELMQGRYEVEISLVMSNLALCR
jgi:hypothetical protein